MRSISNQGQILVVGASFAGLATAYWMKELGYDVTLAEASDAPKKGGTPVDIRDDTIEIVKRMGLYEQIESNALPPKSMELKRSDGSRIGGRKKDSVNEKGDGFEIERDTLLSIMFGLVKDEVELVFGDRIASLREAGDEIVAYSARGDERRFKFVFGCDGVHSDIRHSWFGPEEQYSHFLQAYGSVTIVQKSLVPENTGQTYNEPGRVISLGAYKGKTDIIQILSSESQIAYDHHDREAKKNIMLQAFSGMGWRTEELLGEIRAAGYFYFDELSQIKMPSWTKGRVALVGDAAYCASPAAGKGGSLAIDGAAALADAFRNNGSDFESAFEEYNRNFSSFVEATQAAAVKALAFLVPKTPEALQKRNEQIDSGKS